MIPLRSTGTRPVPTLVLDLVNPCHPIATEQVAIQTAEGLTRLLGRLPEPGAGDALQLWLRDLAAWLHGPKLTRAARPSAEQPPNPARISFLLRVLDVYPEHRAALVGAIEPLLVAGAAVRLFADAGLPSQSGVLGEAAARLGRRAMPLPNGLRDLGELLAMLLPGEPDAAWLEELSPAMLHELVALIGPLLAPTSPSGAAVRRDLEHALALVAVRASGLGLERELRPLTSASPTESPFLALPNLATALVDAARLGDERHATQARLKCHVGIEACRVALDRARAQLEGEGLSADLVFRVGLGHQLLDRMERLTVLRVPGLGSDVAHHAVALLASVTRGRGRMRELRGLVASSAQTLGRRIAELAGRYGEHCITETRDEYHQQIHAASGGGALTAFTTLFKLLLGAVTLPLFFEGLFVSLNYALSFLAMQLCGFSLATKQTSFMAAALARALKLRDERGVVEIAARVFRTQLAGVLGNVGAVVPGAVAIDLGWRLATGHPVLSPERAHHVIESLHPFHSATPLYAAVTGVMLWLASMASGWFENWAAHRGLQAALALHLRGDGLLARAGRALLGSPASTAGSVTLGGLMGMVPVLARFVGLPLEVRHVTLATGGLALAGCAVGPFGVTEAGFLWAAAGIAIIALMNFGVGFSLSLVAAVRIHQLDVRLPGRLAREVLRALLLRPRDFLFPPEAAARPELPLKVSP